jgi:hypothetical protein
MRQQFMHESQHLKDITDLDTAQMFTSLGTDFYGKRDNIIINNDDINRKLGHNSSHSSREATV